MSLKRLLLFISIVIIHISEAYYSDALNCYTETVMSCRALYGRADNFNQAEYKQCEPNARELCCLLFPSGECYKR